MSTYTRDGVPSLLDAARILCRLLTKFSPILAAKYSDNPALLAALAAATAACGPLLQELEGVRSYGD